MTSSSTKGDGQDRASPSGRAADLRPQPPTASSRGSIPDAVRPFTVAGYAVTVEMVCDAAMRLANAPFRFKASVLHPAIFPEGEPFPWARSEAINRLMQRWRKEGIAHFEYGRWFVGTAGWLRLQRAAAQAIETRRAETERLGAQHESAVPQGCAHTPSESPHHDK